MRNAAVVHLTQSLSDQLGPAGIMVNLVHPGTTRTERSDPMDAEQARREGVRVEESARRIPPNIAIRRIVAAREIGYRVTCLAAPKSTAVTGEVIAAGGGSRRAVSQQGPPRVLNRYRFALPYVCQVFVRYAPEGQRLDLQRRLAEALEDVYAGDRDRVSALLVTLFVVTGQEARALPYRHRTQVMASLEALRWQVIILETLVARDVEGNRSDHYRLFEVRVALSAHLWEERQWEEGVLQAERAWMMARTWHDERREARALTLVGLNREYGAQFAQAEKAHQRALAIRERVLGPEHPDTATSLNNLALVYTRQGRDGEAEPLHQRALAIRERVLGPEHPDTATSLNNLALLYAHQGQCEKAAPLLEQALRLSQQLLGEDHPSTQILKQNLEGVKTAMR